MHLTPDGPVVLFGGSFDPPTLAHITLASLAAEALSASRLVYVLAAVSPHKLNQPPASDDDRLAMLRLARLGLPAGILDTCTKPRGLMGWIGWPGAMGARLLLQLAVTTLRLQTLPAAPER